MKPWLASGTVWHAREAPGRHSFGYHMTYLWCDIDALDRGEGSGRWISAGPGGLLQLRRGDHLQGTDGSWREGIEPWLAKAGIGTAPTIHVLTLPRLFGRTFNPVSFWIGQGDQGQVLWMVAEVNNTFGERHLYPLDSRACPAGRLEWTTPKAFPVSPFHGVEGSYEFRLELTESGLTVGIDLVRHGEGVFRTGMGLRFGRLGSWSLAGEVLAMASSVVLTVPRILCHAALLHFSGKARLKPRPGGADAWTIHRGEAVLLQRTIANPAMGAIWKRLGQIMTRSKISQPGAGNENGSRHPVESA